MKYLCNKKSQSGPESSSGIIDGMSLSGYHLLPVKKNCQNKQTYFKMKFQALLLVTKQAEPIKSLLIKCSKQQLICLFSVVLSSTLQCSLNIVCSQISSTCHERLKHVSLGDFKHSCCLPLLTNDQWRLVCGFPAFQRGRSWVEGWSTPRLTEATIDTHEQQKIRLSPTAFQTTRRREFKQGQIGT